MPKGYFLSDRRKSPEFYALKNVKKKPIVVLKKENRATAPASTADPKKVKKKSILISANFVLHFWLRLLDAVLMNTMFIVWK
jgi:hypothetical protein